MHAVFALSTSTGACDHPEAGRLAAPFGVDTVREPQERGRGLINGFGIQLDLKGTPLAGADRDDGINLIAVGVTPRVDSTIEKLGIYPKVTNNETLEVEPESVEVMAQLA